jgi:hypothetical protein
VPVAREADRARHVRSDTSYEIPLSDADQAALRPAWRHGLGAIPFESGALISRSLWVIFIGEWGVWTHAVLPVDDRLDMPDRKSITGLCDLVGSFMRPPLCHDNEKAMIVLRRPGPAEITEADAYIFRLVRQAAIDRETAPWTFYVVGPGGVREVPELGPELADEDDPVSRRPVVVRDGS